MPLQATSGAATYDAFGGAAPVANYIEDVFSTFLYTGNGSTQTINNGIDLASKGGLVWIKGRSNADDHMLADTARGTNKILTTGGFSSTSAETTVASSITAFNASGFSIGTDSNVNQSSKTYVSWTFRKQPKFFDVVTYTGDGNVNRTVSHNLGSAPGFVIAKRLDAPSEWMGWHRFDDSPSTGYVASINQTVALTNIGGKGDFTATTFAPDVLRQSNNVSPVANVNGATYVAYLFAHNAGGFGLSGTDNVITCGSFTTDSSGNATINLGYEPQWVLFKAIAVVDDWRVLDNMRGWSMTADNFLFPNSSGAEVASSNWGNPTATGFTLGSGGSSRTYIYVAIRRGPMKTPTTGTSVYNAVYSNATANVSIPVSTIGFQPDTIYEKSLNGSSGVPNSYGNRFMDRLRGFGATLSANTPGLPSISASSEINYEFGTTGTIFGTASGTFAPYQLFYWFFRRAPGFFDEVCYTGTGANPNTLNHNLGVIPQFVIYRRRNSTGDWETAVRRNDGVYSQQSLNSNGAAYGTLANATAAGLTATTINPPALGTGVNISGGTYVAYLFASCPGVSSVGSYAGTGALITIDCGFTGGARFVLVKRTDSTGNWWVFDTVRGMTTGTDPRLALNNTDAQTNNDWINTVSTGFQIVTTDASVNTSGGTYIYLAIA